jgi:hypothetical protein
MAELGSTMLEVIQEHLQNLVSQWYMTATKLATCYVSKHPASPAPPRGYIMACTTLYELEFIVPSH